MASYILQSYAFVKILLSHQVFRHYFFLFQVFIFKKKYRNKDFFYFTCLFSKRNTKTKVFFYFTCLFLKNTKTKQQNKEIFRFVFLGCILNMRIYIYSKQILHLCKNKNENLLVHTKKNEK